RFVCLLSRSRERIEERERARQISFLQKAHLPCTSEYPAWDGCLRSATPIAPESSALSAHAVSPVQKGNCMKKTKDEMRAEYKRSDFTKLERGKFYKEVAKG